jgi:hypothetical protein
MTAFLANDPDNVEALIHLGNAKAKLLNSDWALFKLTDARSTREFVDILHRLRPATPAQDDAAADVAFRKAVAVAPSDLAYGLARMFGTYAESASQTIAVFRAMGDAERWLGIDITAAQASSTSRESEAQLPMG